MIFEKLHNSRSTKVTSFSSLFQPGDKVMVIPSLSDAEAANLFPNGVTTKELPSGKKYLRYTQI